MRRTLLQVLAVSLTLAAPISVSAALPDWCDICDDGEACYACCRCEGTPPEQCGPGCSLADEKLASTDPLFAPNQCPTSEELASFEVTGQRERAAVDRFLELLDERSR